MSFQYRPSMTFIFRCWLFTIDSWSKTKFEEAKPYTSWDEFRKEAEWDKIKPIRREWTAYAWPGGYPLFHLTKDNGILCTKCANENLKLTLGDDPQWQIIHSEINYTDKDLYCDNCYEKIESAYGEEVEDEG